MQAFWRSNTEKLCKKYRRKFSAWKQPSTWTLPNAKQPTAHEGLPERAATALARRQGRLITQAITDFPSDPAAQRAEPIALPTLLNYIKAQQPETASLTDATLARKVRPRVDARYEVVGRGLQATELRIRRTLKTEHPESTCTICEEDYDRSTRRAVVFLPCVHQGCCQQCTHGALNCFFCRAAVDGIGMLLPPETQVYRQSREE